MPGRPTRGKGGDGDAPRTDLPPTKIPYDDDYFGTGEEEGVVRERELSEREGEPPLDRPGVPGASRDRVPGHRRR